MSKSYYILNGVRRSIAAREAGQKTILAIVHARGKRPLLKRVSLQSLFSPKKKMESDARFFRILPPIKEPIEVEALGLSGQLPVTPLSDVKIV